MVASLSSSAGAYRPVPSETRSVLGTVRPEADRICLLRALEVQSSREKTPDAFRGAHGITEKIPLRCAFAHSRKLVALAGTTAIQRHHSTRETVMRISAFATLLLASTLAAGNAVAQPAPFNEVGVTMGHWHIISRDVEANKKIFIGMGGKLFMPGG